MVSKFLGFTRSTGVLGLRDVGGNPDETSMKSLSRQVKASEDLVRPMDQDPASAELVEAARKNREAFLRCFPHGASIVEGDFLSSSEQ